MNSIVQQKEEVASLITWNYLDRSQIHLETKAQKCARRETSQTVTGFYSPTFALSI